MRTTCKKGLSGVIAVFFLMMSTGTAFADQGNVENEELKKLHAMVAQMEQRYQSKIQDLEKEVSSLRKQNASIEKSMESSFATQAKRLEACSEQISSVGLSGVQAPSIVNGLEIGFGATSVIQGIAGGGNGTAGDVTDASYSADLEITKEFENGGIGFAHVEMGQGDGIDDDEVVFLAPVNGDAANSDGALELTELYYEQPLWDERVVITAGKIDPSAYYDDNAIANDETAQFLGAGFVNGANIDFADVHFGARIGVQVSDSVYLNAGVVEGDGDFEDVADGVFTFGQLAYSPQFIEKEGNYRLFGWHSGVAHEALKDTAMTKEHAYGFGISADQVLNDYLTWFGRVSYASADVVAVEYAWSSGLQFEGDVWNREDDYLGVAFGQSIPGADLEKSRVTNHVESQLELYYNYQVFDHLSVSPHFQLVFNPNGVDEENVGGASDSTAAILSLRTNVSF